jgi:hypothetical protein
MNSRRFIRSSSRLEDDCAQGITSGWQSHPPQVRIVHRKRDMPIRLWVKGGKVQTEQMFSGLRLKADARRLREKNRKHPAMERVKDAFS